MLGDRKPSIPNFAIPEQKTIDDFQVSKLGTFSVDTNIQSKARLPKLSAQLNHQLTPVT
jgi:hypothetical protein